MNIFANFLYPWTQVHRVSLGFKILLKTFSTFSGLPTSCNSPQSEVNQLCSPFASLMYPFLYFILLVHLLQFPCLLYTILRKDTNYLNKRGSDFSKRYGSFSLEYSIQSKYIGRI